MIHIRLTQECNFKCIFCHIPQLKPKQLSFRDVLKIIMSVDHSSPNIFSISWWEPWSVAYLSKLIKFIKKCNAWHHINLETNGFFLSNYAYTQELVDSWLNSILLSFHSHKEDDFNKITWVKKWFTILEKTFEVLKKVDIEVEISLVLCKYNYNDLYYTVKYLNEKVNYRWLLVSNIFERINYDSKKDFHIELENIYSPLLKAYNLLKKSKKEINSCWIPMCYLTWFEDSYYIWQFNDNRYYQKSSKCDKCIINNYCRWIIWDYADIYGVDSVKPLIKTDKVLINKLMKLKQGYLLSEDVKINNCEK